MALRTDLCGCGGQSGRAACHSVCPTPCASGRLERLARVCGVARVGGGALCTVPSCSCRWRGAGPSFCGAHPAAALALRATHRLVRVPWAAPALSSPLTTTIPRQQQQPAPPCSLGACACWRRPVAADPHASGRIDESAAQTAARRSPCLARPCWPTSQPAAWRPRPSVGAALRPRSFALSLFGRRRPGHACVASASAVVGARRRGCAAGGGNAAPGLLGAHPPCRCSGRSRAAAASLADAAHCLAVGARRQQQGCTWQQRQQPLDDTARAARTAAAAVAAAAAACRR